MCRYQSRQSASKYPSNIIRKYACEQQMSYYRRIWTIVVNLWRHKIWLSNYDMHIAQGNRTLKFGHLMEYNRKAFLQKTCRKWGRATCSRPLFVFWEVWYKVKASDQHLSFHLLSTVDPEICSILIFIKDSGTSFFTIVFVLFFKKNIALVIFY